MRDLRRRITALAMAMVLLVPAVSHAQVSDEKALGLLLEFVWDYFLRWALLVVVGILLIRWLVGGVARAAEGDSEPYRPEKPPQSGK